MKRGDARQGLGRMSGHGSLRETPHMPTPPRSLRKHHSLTTNQPLPHQGEENFHWFRLMLAIDGLTKRFGGLVAVSGVSFAVGRWLEVVAIVGPNGAGKTTLFNLDHRCDPARCSERWRLTSTMVDAAGRPPSGRASASAARFRTSACSWAPERQVSWKTS